MTKQDIEKIVEDYIKDKLTIELTKDWDYYREDPALVVTLYLDGKEIYETRTW